MTRKKSRGETGDEPGPTLPRHVLMLALVAVDATFEQAHAARDGAHRVVWQGKCIHCRAALIVDPQRPNASVATVEHIVPQALGGRHSPENLALACARCNNQKGTRIDPLGLAHPRLQAVVQRLQTERLKRLRHPPREILLPATALTWLGIAP